MAASRRVGRADRQRRGRDGWRDDAGSTGRSRLVRPGGESPHFLVPPHREFRPSVAARNDQGLEGHHGKYRTSVARDRERIGHENDRLVEETLEFGANHAPARRRSRRVGWVLALAGILPGLVAVIRAPDAGGSL